jgi:hypothetical protein
MPGLHLIAERRDGPRDRDAMSGSPLLAPDATGTLS